VKIEKISINEVEKLLNSEIAIQSVKIAEKALSDARSKVKEIKAELEKELEQKAAETKLVISKLAEVSEGEVKEVVKFVEKEADKVVALEQKEVKDHPVISAIVLVAIGVIVGVVSVLILK
jgi:ElaB/YqjD/DUF883 family membrane-anchored ribosome-binding protein